MSPSKKPKNNRTSPSQKFLGLNPIGKKNLKKSSGDISMLPRTLINHLTNQSKINMSYAYVKVALNVNKRLGTVSLKLKVQKPKPVPAKIEIHLQDIDLFFNSRTEGGKGQNDDSNKKRELVLTNLFTLDPSYFEDVSYGCKWTDLKIKFWNYLKNNFEKNPINEGKTYDEIEIKQKAGRGHNYDFVVFFKSNKQIIYKIAKLEFKSGKSFENIPQFLSIATSNTKFQFIPSAIPYEDVYYQSYLPEVVKLLDTDIVIPDIKTYKRLVKGTKRETHPLFDALYNADQDELFKKSKNMIVANSITDYLENKMKKEEIIWDVIQQKFNESQSGKIFMVWNGVDFTESEFTEDDLKLTGNFSIKNGNTLVFPTVNNNNINFLLRWKNRNGILLPAWQISCTR
jgi:hypothetical protein